MAPRSEKSQLKRQRGNEESDLDFKKPRRSERLSNLGAPTAPVTPVASPAQARPAAAGRHSKSHHTSKHQQKQHLPSPQTHSRATDDDDEEDDELHSLREATATPPDGRVPGQAPPKVGSDDVSSPAYNTFSSPPQDTQPFSQYVDPDAILSDEVEDEVKEGVWGYLFPLNTRYGGRCQVLKKRTACPKPDNTCNQANSSKKAGKLPQGKDGNAKSGANSATSGGYLIGRHPECDIVVDDISVSNRHCLIFTEHKGNDTVAILEDLSSNGTFINDALIGRNQRRELQEQDEIAVLDKARFIFKYPKTRQTSAFLQQYTLLEKLGKGHFAEVFLCVEKATGQRYAVKIFTKHPGIEERSKTEGLQQEIAVLMGVSHPNVLCLKDTFNERNAVYLVLELAAEGELFNHIVMKQKLTEDESRKLFLQLFHGVKYLHDRNIVHRDIKPENILMVDKDLHVKLADFGLAKIIGEESFTTTLCGTPSYVAPEILADSKNRKYTKAVDIWSLGVVLYICLCGFPPFSDELFSQDFPFTLSQQIRSGRFDYPSPYWDSVGDPALDLIDSMLVVDPEKRFTIDQCLSHPWMTHSAPGVNDSTGGLVGGIQGLDVNRRGVARERTMLSSLNYVEVTTAKVGAGDKPAVKIFSKNKNKHMGKVVNAARKEASPSHQRDAGEFMEMGGKGDVELFSHDGNSVYSKADLAAEKKKKTKGGR